MNVKVLSGTMAKRYKLVNLLIVAFISFSYNKGFAQSYSSLKFKDEKGLFGNRCDDYEQTMRKVSKQAGFGLLREGREIFLVLPSVELFHKLFTHSGDGVTVEILQKDQFSCESEEESPEGYLLHPLYKKQLKKRLALNQLNEAVINIGEIPFGFSLPNVECNLWVLQRKAVCQKRNSVNAPQELWDLLETGLYYDSTGYEVTQDTILPIRKEITYTLNFLKDEAAVEDGSLSILFDSLEKENFIVDKIWVEAFTSIEGSKEYNQALQKERIKILVDELQSFQDSTIKIHYRSRENWPAFRKDVYRSQFSWLLKLSQQEIKDTINSNAQLALALEPMLEKHRIGRIKRPCCNATKKACSVV